MPSDVPVRAIRGATQVDADDATQILGRTRELLAAILAENALTSDAVVDVIFTATRDLRSRTPAEAARALGWTDVPLLCVQEMDVDHALPRCIRVLMHVQTDTARTGLTHVYLHGARALRPDLADG